MPIQAILFDKNKWDEKTASDWLKKHDHHPIKKVHITKNYLRYRLEQPSKFSNYITKKLDNGIDLVIPMANMEVSGGFGNELSHVNDNNLLNPFAVPHHHKHKFKVQPVDAEGSGDYISALQAKRFALDGYKNTEELKKDRDVKKFLLNTGKDALKSLGGPVGEMISSPIDQLQRRHAAEKRKQNLAAENEKAFQERKKLNPNARRF